MKVPGISVNAANDEKVSWLVEDQENWSTCLKADAVDRCRILHSIVEKLKQELSIKDQIIWLLKVDKNKAEDACHVATKELIKIKRKVKNAAIEQKQKRRQQTRQIASIVGKLVAEVEALTMNDGLSQAAMENLQPLLDSCRTSTVGLELFDLKQAETLDALEKGPDLLRQRLVQDRTSNATTSPLPTLTEVDDTPSADRNVPFAASSQSVPSTPKLPELGAKHFQSPDDRRIPQLEQALEVTSLQAQQWQTKAMEFQTALHDSKDVYHEEIGKLRTEIQAVSRKLATSSTRHREDVKPLKNEIRVLEEQGRERKKASSSVQTQKHAVQEESEAMKRTIELSEKDRTQALNELGQLRDELRSIKEKYLLDCEKHVAKLAKNLDSFTAERSEMMCKLKKRDERIEELKLQSGKHTAGKSNRNEVRSLENERDSLQHKLAELRAESADREAEVLRLRQFCSELQEDISGLNIALQAKQQENALLKRDRVVRQVVMDTPTTQASTKSFAPLLTARMHTQLPEQSLNRPRKSHPNTVDGVKNPGGDRQALSTITNQMRAPHNVSSVDNCLLVKSAAHEKGWPLVSRTHTEVDLSQRGPTYLSLGH